MIAHSIGSDAAIVRGACAVDVGDPVDRRATVLAGMGRRGRGHGRDDHDDRDDRDAERSKKAPRGAILGTSSG
jgi:hypothetical protein